ncbi:hypothetical protein Theam_0049 [Thermovibrio ammonificans HB-1]|uniref:Lipoprotein n=1 Tax=Thermovibrio ammonificans (strain DSM 15698 / JCM 12110 / HB-1) TaxID=648996 RepID=E8T318_THEA1|nr:hypothetical protein [Thermovibrio ammonificans]ADU96023.1 hypothetical protein Theam_0049 [Thermovibrio ammonificans HB-1]
MKKALAVGGVILLASCGGGGGGGTSSVSTTTETYKLAEISSPEEVEATPTTTARTINSLTGISSEGINTRGGSSQPTGLIPQILNRIKDLNPSTSRGIASIRCDNGNWLGASVLYELKEGVVQEQSCSDIKYIRIALYSKSDMICRLGDYIVGGDKVPQFVMKITASDLKDPDCLPQSATIEVSGTVKHLKNGTPDEAYPYDGYVDETYIYDNLKLTYTNITWSGEELSSANYELTGWATYVLGDFPLATEAQIDYDFDIAGSGNETSDSFSGYVKLGCLDGWLKVQTTRPLKYSGDEVTDGEITVQAQNGSVVISYSSNGMDITQTIDNQTETYHYDNEEQVKESLKGVVCTD